MSLYEGKTAIIENTLNIAKLCLQAAYKAPQMTGKRNINSAIITGKDILPVIEVMEVFASFMSPMAIDAMSYRLAYEEDRCPTIIAFGTNARHSDLNYNCGACGFESCAKFNSYTAKNEPSPGVAYEGPSCIWKLMEFGMAVDWASAAASQNNVTNRVQLSVGLAARMLGYVENCSIALGLPVGPADEDLYWYNRPPKILNSLLKYEDQVGGFMTFLSTYFEAFPASKTIMKVKDKWWEHPQINLRLVPDDKEELELTAQNMGEAFAKIMDIRQKVAERKKAKQ